MSDCTTISSELVCYTVGLVKRTLVAHYEYGKNAADSTILVSTRYTDEAGVPVNTAAGVVTVGECAVAGLPNTQQSVAACGDVGRNLIAFGANALGNGDFERSVGIGATSIAGPVWTTQGLVNVRWGYWTGTANPFAVLPALGTRSLWVDVGIDVNESIIEWSDIYLVNGQTYALEADAMIINAPFALRVAVDGVTVVPMTAPAATRVWEKTSSTFVFTGVSGYHRLGVFSNTGVGGGNDHGLDNFALRLAASVAEPEVLTAVETTDRVAVLVQGVAKTAGCNDERRDLILADMSRSLAANTSAAITLSLAISGPIAVCVTNAGVATTQYMRQVYSVNGNTGVDVLLRTEYSTNGNAWTLVVPTGVITMGACVMAATRNVGGVEVAGVAVVTLPANVTAFTVTAQTGGFDVSFDAGATFPLLNITGSRSWGGGGTLLNGAQVRIRGTSAASAIDIITETA